MAMVSFSMGIGGSFMSKCPFWSTKKEKVNCYSECPMRGSTEEENDDCPFKEISKELKISYTDIDDEKSSYSQESYVEYEFLKKISTY